jgi:hypothetical protein
MTRDDAKQLISTLEEGVDKDVRLGLSTRSVCKVGNDKFEINDFVDGWSTATVTEVILEDVLCGEKSLLDLNWR